MSFTLGVFDVFTYGIPGVIYLTVGVYVAVHTGLFNLHDITSVGSIPLALVAAALSYFIGQATYRFGALFSRILPGMKGRQAKDIVDQFLHRCPQAVGRAFVGANSFVLYTRIQLYNQEAALEIARLRSSGLMLRQSVLPLAITSAVALGEFFLHPQKWRAIIAFLVLGLLAWGALMQGRQLAIYTRWRTLEIAFWIDDIDDALSHSAKTTRTQEIASPATGVQKNASASNRS